jgi:hypothetical protein
MEDGDGEGDRHEAGARLVDLVLIWTGQLFRLNIDAQQLMDRLNRNFFDEI